MLTCLCNRTAVSVSQLRCIFIVSSVREKLISGADQSEMTSLIVSAGVSPLRSLRCGGKVRGLPPPSVEMAVLGSWLREWFTSGGGWRGCRGEQQIPSLRCGMTKATATAKANADPPPSAKDDNKKASPKQIPHSTSLRAGSSGMTTRKAKAKAGVSPLGVSPLGRQSAPPSAAFGGDGGSWKLVERVVYERRRVERLPRRTADSFAALRNDKKRTGNGNRKGKRRSSAFGEG